MQTTSEHPDLATADETTLAQVVARLSAEVSGPLTLALNRISQLVQVGRIDGQGLQALRREIDGARRAGLMGQKIARFASAQAHPGIERVELGQALRGVLTDQAAAATAGAPGHRHTLVDVTVMSDASLVHTVIQAAASWAQGLAVGHIDWVLDAEPALDQARLACRFDCPLPDAQANEDTEHIDTLDWLLLRYSAHMAGVQIARDFSGGRCSLSLRLRHLVTDQMAGASVVELHTGPGPRAALAGCQVLVLAARREARQRVRQALHGHEVFIDYVPSVAAAEAYCDDGTPQVLVFESAMAGEALSALRKRLASMKPSVAVIEVMPTGQGCELGPTGMRLGADGLSRTLASVLLMELARQV